MENLEYKKPFRISLKLAEGKSPHLYVTQLKVLMDKDTSLHPLMEKTLKLLKKTRTPYITLAKLREVVFDPLNFRHFDRSAEPRGSWVATLWSEEEIKQHIENPQEHIKASFKLFTALGYDFYNTELVSQEYIASLEELTSKQIDSQLEGRK
jgi:hypothetical protein